MTNMLYCNLNFIIFCFKMYLLAERRNKKVSMDLPKKFSQSLAAPDAPDLNIMVTVLSMKQSVRCFIAVSFKFDYESCFRFIG